MQKFKSFRFSWVPKLDEETGIVLGSGRGPVSSTVQAALTSARGAGSSSSGGKGSEEGGKAATVHANKDLPDTSDELLDLDAKPKSARGVKFSENIDCDDQLETASTVTSDDYLDDDDDFGSPPDSRSASPTRLMRKYSIRTAKFLKEEAVDLEEESKCIKQMTNVVAHVDGLTSDDSNVLRALLPADKKLEGNTKEVVQKLMVSFKKWQAELEAGLQLQQQLMESKNRRQIRAMKYNHSVNQGTQKVRRHVVKQKEEITTLKEELDQTINDGLITSTMLDRVSWQYKTLKSQYYHEVIPNASPTLSAVESSDPQQQQQAGKPGSAPGGARLVPSLYGGPTGTVTLAFTDVQGSTELWDQAEEAMKESLKLHNELIRKLITKYEGYEVKTEGDAFMVAFSSAINALRWCAEVQLQLLKLPWPEAILKQPAAQPACDESTGVLLWNGLRVRMGLHIGLPRCEVDPVTKRYDYFGPMVNMSARVSGKAEPGQLVTSHTFYEVVKSQLSKFYLGGGLKETFIGAHNLKGISKVVHLVCFVPKQIQGRKFTNLTEAAASASAGAPGSKAHDKAVEKLTLNALKRMEHRRYKGALAESMRGIISGSSTLVDEVLRVRKPTLADIAKCQGQVSKLLTYFQSCLKETLETFMSTRTTLRYELDNRNKHLRCTCHPDKNAHKADIPKAIPVYIESLYQTEFMRNFSTRKVDRSPSPNPTAVASGTMKEITFGGGEVRRQSVRSGSMSLSTPVVPTSRISPLQQRRASKQSEISSASSNCLSPGGGLTTPGGRSPMRSLSPRQPAVSPRQPAVSPRQPLSSALRSTDSGSVQRRGSQVSFKDFDSSEGESAELQTVETPTSAAGTPSSRKSSLKQQPPQPQARTRGNSLLAELLPVPGKGKELPPSEDIEALLLPNIPALPPNGSTLSSSSSEPRDFLSGSPLQATKVSSFTTALNSFDDSPLGSPTRILQQQPKIINFAPHAPPPSAVLGPSSKAPRAGSITRLVGTKK